MYSENKDDVSPVIEVRNLTKRFVKRGQLAAVNNVSFHVGKEVVSLLGPSGCGKTTTLRCIAGLETPDEGEVLINGKTVTSTEKGIFVPPEKRDVGLVFQSYALWPHMKIYDNVAYGLKIRHIQRSEIENRVRKALEIVNLTGYEDRYPAQLSGGEQQRVALARSLVYEPKVLLLDEPLSNLDAKIRERTRIELKYLLSRIGISTVYVTHDQEEAFLISDRIVVINEGKIMQQGSPFDIYQYPANRFVASFVGRSNMIEGVVLSKNEADDGGAKGVVRILDDYEIECALPHSLRVGDKCLVMTRANEIGLYDEPSPSRTTPCEVIERGYKGSTTDYVVKVGNTSLVVSTHRFCDLSQEDTMGITPGKHYLHIPKEAVSVVQMH